MGWTIDQIYELTKIDKWFLAQMKELVDFEEKLWDVARFLAGKKASEIVTILQFEQSMQSLVSDAKKLGYSDVQLAQIFGVSQIEIRQLRKSIPGGQPVYKLVDTCAAEFEAYTPYYYSTYETPYAVVDVGLASASGTSAGKSPLAKASPTKSAKTVTEDEIRLSDKPKVIIIGGGPNRIGQGIEFDYCCVQAAFAMKEMGLESVMINSNPETVSTDYDTSDLLFFEPLTHEDVLNICERLNGGPFTRNAELGTRNLVKGVIVQFGGQTPLNLAKGLKDAGVPILGTTVESIDAAGDREQFRTLLQKLGLKQPANGIARNSAEAREIAKKIGYPVLVRPSFVLGGRAMEIVSDEDQLNYYMTHAVEAVAGGGTGADQKMENPILIDKFLDNATEVDVDCLADYEPEGSGFRVQGSGNATDSSLNPEPRTLNPSRAIIIGVMEHIEEAGIHSGDSACALPPYSLSKEIVAELKRQTKELAKALRVRGLMNVQYAIKDNQIYVIEVNPRASRTVPFVSKAHGIPFAKIAAKVMAGKSLDELGITEPPPPKHTSVKEVVFPFSKFPGVDVILGPEMRSTGEVMGIDANFPLAFAKSQIAAGGALPTKGRIYISVNNADKPHIAPIAKALVDCGFELIATDGTFKELQKNDIPATRLAKLNQGRPNIADYIKNKEIQLIINTPTKKGPATDEGKIRAMAILHKIPIITTLTAAKAAAGAIKALQKGEWTVKPLQDYMNSTGY